MLKNKYLSLAIVAIIDSITIFRIRDKEYKDYYLFVKFIIYLNYIRMMMLQDAIFLPFKIHLFIRRIFILDLENYQCTKLVENIKI